MRTVLLSLLSTALLQTTAHAGVFDTEPADDDIYVFGFGGGSFLSDNNFTGISDPDIGVPGASGSPLSVQLDYDDSTFFGGGVGYQLPFRYLKVFHPRLELEVSRFSADISGGSFNNGIQSFAGEQEATLLYFNNYSDIVFSPNQRLTPYIGGGLGVAFVDANAPYFPATASAPVFTVTGSETAFSSHAAAGLSYEVTPNIDLYTEGRYFRTYGLDLERRFIDAGVNLRSGDVSDNLEGFTATGGLRFRF